MMRIAISSEPRLLNILRAVVRFCSQGAGLAKPDAEYLALAVDEAAANVIKHTYCGHNAMMALEVRVFPDRLEFILEDWGPKVCEDLIRPRPLDDLRPGGLGTFFIFTFMDKVFYDPAFTGGNRLTMIKLLSRKGAPCNESSSAKAK